MSENPNRTLMRKTSFLSVAWLALLAVVGLTACSSGGGETDGPDGILLISVEAIRPDLLSTYGGGVDTPNLDRLASLGTVFEDSATVVPMSRPSATTLLTGMAPDRTGVRNDTSDLLEDDPATLAEHFRERGRYTLGIVGTLFCSHYSGLTAGFDLFDGPDHVPYGPARFHPVASDEEEIAQKFATWVKSAPADETWFGWLHMAGLHGQATRKESLEESLDSYRERLATTDTALGAILDALEAAGRLDRTAIVLTGTYGTLLGEKEARGHSYWLREETLRVPLVVKPATGMRGFAPGTRDDRRVWLPDVARTLASMDGIELEGEEDALDLADPATGESRRVRRAWTWATDDELDWPTLTAVDAGSGWETFPWNAASQPFGAVDDPDLVAQAGSRPATPRQRDIPKALKDRVTSLELVPDWDEPDTEPLAGAERDRFLSELQYARQMFVERTRQIVRWRYWKDLKDRYPDNPAVLSGLLYIFIDGSGVKLARANGREALAAHPNRPEILHWAGHTYFLTGEPEKAEALVEAALSLVGTDPDMMYDLACTRALHGDADGSISRLQQSIDAGFRNWQHMETDSDLESIRTDPRFIEIMRSHGR